MKLRDIYKVHTNTFNSLLKSIDISSIYPLGINISCDIAHKLLVELNVKWEIKL